MTRLSCSQVLGVLDYEPSTGVFRWKITRENSPVGTVAGSLNVHGYITIGLLRQQHLAHRLAWLIMTGEWPVGDIDHKDGDRANNRWDNLRSATRAQNIANSGLRRTNTSGLKGASWNAERKKWIATIQVERKSMNIGAFDTKEAAHSAYMERAQQVYGNFVRTQEGGIR